MTAAVNGASRLDVPLVLRRVVLAPLADPAPVILGAILLVLLPGVVTRLIDSGGDAGTLLVILRTILAMLYAAVTASIVVARLSGRPLTVGASLARATPGVQVALLVGAAVVAGLTLHLFARHGTVAGWLLDSLLFSAGLLAASTLLPLVPVAVVEGLAPLAAMRRAAALTMGNRNRILALVLVALLTLAPLAALGFGFGTAGPWPVALFESLAWGLAAVVPPVLYASLATGAAQ